MNSDLSPALGDSADLTFTVAESDTAAALGSGDVPALATPRLLAWLEAVTLAALALPAAGGVTSLVSRVEIEHRAASPVGAEVVVHASACFVDGRLVRFDVAAEQTVRGSTSLVATGQITRVLVDRARFLARI